MLILDGPIPVLACALAQASQQQGPKASQANKYATAGKGEGYQQHVHRAQRGQNQNPSSSSSNSEVDTGMPDDSLGGAHKPPNPHPAGRQGAVLAASPFMQEPCIAAEAAAAQNMSPPRTPTPSAPPEAGVKAEPAKSSPTPPRPPTASRRPNSAARKPPADPSSVSPARHEGSVSARNGRKDGAGGRHSHDSKSWHVIEAQPSAGKQRLRTSQVGGMCGHAQAGA